MIKFLITFLCIGVMTSCKQNNPETSEQSVSHDDLVNEFQDCQKDFVATIAKIKDAKTFDTQAKRWNQVNAKFNQLAHKLKSVSAPSPEKAKEMRQKIVTSNEVNAPTGEMMFTLLSIPSREKEVLFLLEEFKLSASNAMIELGRLYGELPTPQEQPSAE